MSGASRTVYKRTRKMKSRRTWVSYSQVSQSLETSVRSQLTKLEHREKVSLTVITRFETKRLICRMGIRSITSMSMVTGMIRRKCWSRTVQSG